MTAAGPLLGDDPNLGTTTDLEPLRGTDGLLEATRLLMFGSISEAEPEMDKRDEQHEWADMRLRARMVRLLKKMRMA